MSKGFTVAVVGATGAVGVELLETLQKRNFPIKDLRLFASARSVGKKLQFKGTGVGVELLEAGAFKGVDFALFSAGASRSKEFAPGAAKQGVRVAPCRVEEPLFDGGGDLRGGRRGGLRRGSRPRRHDEQRKREQEPDADYQ